MREKILVAVAPFIVPFVIIWTMQTLFYVAGVPYTENAAEGVLLIASMVGLVTVCGMIAYFFSF